MKIVPFLIFHMYLTYRCVNRSRRRNWGFVERQANDRWIGPVVGDSGVKFPPLRDSGRFVIHTEAVHTSWKTLAGRTGPHADAKSQLLMVIYPYIWGVIRKVTHK